MDEKEYLKSQIGKCRFKMNMAKLADCGVLGAAAGGIAGMLCEAASLVWPFYYVHLAAGLCFAAGFLAGACYAFCRRADMRQAAGKLDSFGLKERMLTAYEQMGNESELARMQREDAVARYRQESGRIRIPLFPDKRHILALLLSAAVVAGLGFVPSPVRGQAQLRHQVQEQAVEEKEKLSEFLDSLEQVEMESLTEEQKTQLQEMAEAMKLSQEELEGADSWDSLAAVTERLNFKYGQAAQGLQELAGQVADPKLAGIAAAQEFAQAAANQNSQQTASLGNSGTSPKEGDGSGQGEGSGEGESSGQGEGSGEGESSGQGEGTGEGSGSGQGEGTGQGSGSGQGGGSGQGSGSGQGQGTGEGSGSGIGGGRGTGSSDMPHEYVSIPNSLGEDGALAGGKNGSQDSEFYRQINGLAWEGEHVDYNSVIGEYTESAYEGIANGRYPSGMESVIRDYFENLNK